MNLSVIVSPSLPPPRHYNIGIGNRLIVSFWALGPTVSELRVIINFNLLWISGHNLLLFLLLQAYSSSSFVYAHRRAEFGKQ